MLLKQGKYQEEIEPLTELLLDRPADLNALANRGLAYLHSGKPREALSDWAAAAQGGSAYAQNELGRLYMMGIPDVLTPNPQIGTEWFRKAAAQGLPEGQQNLDKALKLFAVPPQR